MVAKPRRKRTKAEMTRDIWTIFTAERETRTFSDKTVEETGRWCTICRYVVSEVYGNDLKLTEIHRDDKEIKQRVSGMLEAAAIHVDNFYDNVPVIASPEEQLALAKFNSVHLDGSVGDLMAMAKTPRTIITRALTETLVASISPEVAPSRCLLPAEFAALPRSLKGTGTGTTLGQNSELSSHPPFSVFSY